jgi:predicted nucleic acid-binding protein
MLGLDAVNNLAEYIVGVADLEEKYNGGVMNNTVRGFDEQQYLREVESHGKDRKIIGAMDLLIAAHALSLNLTLVTNNTKEFNRVQALALENWVTS